MSNTESINSQEARYAHEAIQVLLKAKKNLRLYPENNPIYLQTLKEAYKRFMQYFDLADSMDLVINRNDIRMGQEVVFNAAEAEENLALFFFRDGLRTLNIKSTLSEDELLEFLQVISNDFDSEDFEDDLVTLLWERDFQSITYKVDDSDLVEEDQNFPEQAEQQAREGANEEEGVSSAYNAVSEQEDYVSMAIMPITVTDDDLGALQQEIEDDKKTKFPKLIDILFEMLYSSDSVDEFKDVVGIIANAVNFSVKKGNLSAAISVMRKAREVHERTKTPEAKVHLERLMSVANSPTLIKIIGKWLDSPKGINETAYKEYVSMLGPKAIPNFIELLGTLQTVAARKAAIYALTVIGRKDYKALAAGLNDSRWFVVRNIVVTFRSIGDKRGLDYISKALKHPEPRVVKEALKFLGEVGGPAAVAQVRDFLYTKDRFVSVVAAQTLGKIGSDSAKASLVEKITGKGFQDMSLSEMKPFFESLARFRTVDIYDFLMGMLGRNPVFGRAKYNELKVCAIYALGLMGSPKALPELEKHRASKDVDIRRHAIAAIKRIEHVQKK